MTRPPWIRPVFLDTNVTVFLRNEEVCQGALGFVRWPHGVPICPRCHSEHHRYLATQERWECITCRRQFSITAGTIFHGSHLKLGVWFSALWMLVNSPKPFTTSQVARRLDITSKSANHVLSSLRLALKLGRLAARDHAALPVDSIDQFIRAYRRKHAMKGDSHLLDPVGRAIGPAVERAQEVVDPEPEFNAPEWPMSFETFLAWMAFSPIGSVKKGLRALSAIAHVSASELKVYLRLKRDTEAR